MCCVGMQLAPDTEYMEVGEDLHVLSDHVPLDAEPSFPFAVE